MRGRLRELANKRRWIVCRRLFVLLRREGESSGTYRSSVRLLGWPAVVAWSVDFRQAKGFKQLISQVSICEAMRPQARPQ